MQINGKTHCFITLLIIVNASLVLGAGLVSAAGLRSAELIVADSMANTLIAQRQELKDEITEFGEKNTGQAANAIKKLLNLENPDDIIYLLGIVIQDPQSPIADEIQKAITSYANKAYIVSALKKAGQNKSVEVNIAAANLLIDMKEELEGLKVMVALIKKGVIDKRIIDIIDRVPTPDKLNGVKMADGKIIYNIEIQQSLQENYKTGTFPQDVQVFTLLMLGAYYNDYDLRNEHEKMSGVIAKADHDYLMNSLHLLKKAVAVYQLSPNVPWELVKQLSESKDVKVAELATEIDEWREKEEKKRWRGIISETKNEDRAHSDVVLQNYLQRFGDTEEEVVFLVNELKKNKNDEMRCMIISLLINSKYQNKIVEEIENIAKDDNSMMARSCAISFFIKKNTKDKVYPYYTEMMKMMIKKEVVNYYDIAKSIHDENIKAEIREFQLKTFKGLAKSNLMKAYLLFCLDPEKVVNDNEYKDIISNAFENADVNKAKMLMEMIQWTKSNRNINKSILEKLKNSKNSEIAAKAKDILKIFELRRTE